MLQAAQLRPSHSDLQLPRLALPLAASRARDSCCLSLGFGHGVVNGASASQCSVIGTSQNAVELSAGLVYREVLLFAEQLLFLLATLLQ